jgi:hypothetical protein
MTWGSRIVYGKFGWVVMRRGIRRGERGRWVLLFGDGMVNEGVYERQG